MDTQKQQDDSNLRCGHCQQPLIPRAMFCPHCGIPVTQDEPEPRLVVMRQSKQTPHKPFLVFLSYAHRDRYLCHQLENHMSYLKYCGIITTWHARKINAGEETIAQIDIHLNAAHIILLLISADFLAFALCHSQEMMQALQRHECGEADVIPVLLRPVIFTGVPFAKLNCLPTNKIPVVSWSNRDRAFVDIAMGIERVVHKRLASVKEYSCEQKVFRHSNQALPVEKYSSDQEDFMHGNQPSAVRLMKESFPRMKEILSFVLSTIVLILLILGLLFGSTVLVQLLNFIPFAGVTVGILTLLAIILLFLYLTLYESHKEKETRRQELEEARRREQQSQEEERAYYEKALAAYQQALCQDHTDALAYRGKGNALAALSRYAEALTSFQQSIALIPHPLTYVSMGHVLTRLGRHNEAVAAYEQALALDASYAPAYTGMSKALLHQGRRQEAEQAREQARRFGDEDVLLVARSTETTPSSQQNLPSRDT